MVGRFLFVFFLGGTRAGKALFGILRLGYSSVGPSVFAVVLLEFLDLYIKFKGIGDVVIVLYILGN